MLAVDREGDAVEATAGVLEEVRERIAPRRPGPGEAGGVEGANDRPQLERLALVGREARRVGPIVGSTLTVSTNRRIW